MDIKKLNEELERFFNEDSKIRIVEEEDLKPFKFTIDYNDGRPEGIIEYGVDEEDAKANLLKTHKYLQGKEERITNVEPVKEDHEEVTLPFTMIHRSSEGPDASGEVTFFPTTFGYEYQCTEKDFNGRGPKWSTIRTIEGIKIWFRNVLFEFGAKTVTIGDETWDIDDFPKNESLNENSDINEDEFTDRIDVSFDISLYDYGVVRNPQNDMTLIGTTPNDEGGYSDYVVMYISLDDVKDVLENNIDDSFYDFVDTNKEQYISRLDNDNLATVIMDINHYNGWWSDQAHYMI